MSEHGLFGYLLSHLPLQDGFDFQRCCNAPAASGAGGSDSDESAALKKSCSDRRLIEVLATWQIYGILRYTSADKCNVVVCCGRTMSYHVVPVCALHEDVSYCFFLPHRAPTGHSDRDPAEAWMKSWRKRRSSRNCSTCRRKCRICRIVLIVECHGKRERH